MSSSLRVPAMVRRRVICDALSREAASYVWPASWLRQHEGELVGGASLLRDVMVDVGRATFDLCQSLLLQQQQQQEASARAYSSNNDGVAAAAATATQPRTWLVLVGAGNNGGDALEVAYHALCAGHCVHVYRMHSSAPPPREAALALQKWQSLRGAVTHTVTPDTRFDVHAYDMVVDGLLGIGVRGGAVRADYARVIACVNALRAPRVAIDIPSGLDSETGRPLGVCVRAHATFTPLTLKPGLLLGHARAFVGQLYYSAMGYHNELLPFSSPSRTTLAATTTTTTTAATAVTAVQEQRQRAALLRRFGCEDLVRFFGAPRSPLAHKGSHGRVVLVGGAAGYGGAIVMAAEAAVCAGAGLTRVLTARGHAAALLTRCPEAMVTELTVPQDTQDTDGADDGVGGKVKESDVSALTSALLAQLQGDRGAAVPNVLAIGPGLGRGVLCTATMRAMLTYAQSHPDVYLVLDADALNALADMQHGNNNNNNDSKATALPRLPRSVLTPHPSEAARLLRCSVADIEADRVGAARRLAALLQGVCVLKGACTVVFQHHDGHDNDKSSNASEEEGGCATYCACIDAGNAGMATGGMGDVLTGVVAAVVAQYAASHRTAAPATTTTTADDDGSCDEGHGAPASLFDAVCGATLAHAVAADVAVETTPGRGTRGLRATELLPHLPLCLNAGVVPVDVQPLSPRWPAHV